MITCEKHEPLGGSPAKTSRLKRLLFRCYASQEATNHTGVYMEKINEKRWSNVTIIGCFNCQKCPHQIQTKGSLNQQESFEIY